MIKTVKLRVMSIVHGKSELCICNSIKSNLKLKHEIISEKKGSNSIQITSVMKKILNNTIFKSFETFIKLKTFY